MTYYNQNLNSTESYDFPTISDPSANYQNIAPLYQSIDPRLSYPTYNANAPSPNSYNLMYQTNSKKMCDLSLPIEAAVTMSTDEELWIETWLSKIGKIQINLNSTIEMPLQNNLKSGQLQKNGIPIHEAKNTLKSSIQVLEKLESLYELLRQNADKMTTAEWKQKTTEIGTMKEEFSKLFSQFENSTVASNLRKAVDNRRKKRLRQKRRKKENALNKIVLNKEKEEAEKKINEWLEHMKEEVERTKMEENMKKDADCVLAEVTKKKSDAKKSLMLITSLKKLRQVREHAAIQRGEKICLEDRDAFDKATEKLIKIWTNALQVYGKEEQGLRIMLEQNATEDSNAIRLARERKITQEWDNVLFGQKWIPSAAYYGLTAADKDLETFIAIRKSWDTFLSHANDENASKIPIGWVTPNPVPQDSWAKFINS